VSAALTGRLTYAGDLEDSVGHAVSAPCLTRDGSVRYIRWVVTDAVFDPDTGKTTLEFDGTELR
jgi:hypothetical protein